MFWTRHQHAWRIVQNSCSMHDQKLILCSAGTYLVQSVNAVVMKARMKACFVMSACTWEFAIGELRDAGGHLASDHLMICVRSSMVIGCA